MRTRLVLALALLMFSTQGTSAPIGTKHYDDPKPAPGFDLIDLNSASHKLTDFRGQVLIVSFWATWCVPCRKELPSLARTADLLRNHGVRVVAINVGEDSSDIKRFLAGTPINLLFLPDQKSRVATAWEVSALPTAFVIDKQGRVAIRVIGGLEWDTESMLANLRILVDQ